MSTTALTQPAASTSSALLKIGVLRLMLPQNEIRALETADTLVRAEAEPHSVGWLRHAQQRWPVYCLSPNLSLLANVPTERRACVLLNTGTGYIGIMCDDVGISQQPRQQRHELPLAMRLPDTPIIALIAMGEEEIVCLTSAEQLVAHVMRQAGM